MTLVLFVTFSHNYKFRISKRQIRICVSSGWGGDWVDLWVVVKQKKRVTGNFQFNFRAPMKKPVFSYPASCTKIFSTKLNMIVKVVKLFTGVLWKRYSNNFIGKHLYRSLFFKKVSRIQAKERLQHRSFPVSFTKYFRMLFFAKHLCLSASPKYPFFVRYVDLSQKKRFLQPWLF